MTVDSESDEPVALLPEIERSLYERPGIGFWFAVTWLGLLVGGCFLLTMVFAAAGTGGFDTPLAGVLMGFLPGMIFGVMTLGFTYAVYPPSAWKVFLVTLFLMVVPALVVGAVVGLRNPWIFGLAIPGLLAGWVLARVGVLVYRRAGWGTISGPAGSWEEHF